MFIMRKWTVSTLLKPSSNFKNGLGGGFQFFYVHPYLGKISNLTNIFQMGWNYQPVVHFSTSCGCFNYSHVLLHILFGWPPFFPCRRQKVLEGLEQHWGQRRFFGDVEEIRYTCVLAKWWPLSGVFRGALLCWLFKAGPKIRSEHICFGGFAQRESFVQRIAGLEKNNGETTISRDFQLFFCE